jgi:hypothetical protein
MADAGIEGDCGRARRDVEGSGPGAEVRQARDRIRQSAGRWATPATFFSAAWDAAQGSGSRTTGPPCRIVGLVARRSGTG